MEEAIAEYQRAVAKAPKDAELRSGSLFSLNYPDFPVEFVSQAHRDYAQCVRTCSAPARTVPSPDRPLRIGVLSGDMRTHSVAYFAEPFICNRPQGCTLTIFATDVARVGDEIRDRLEKTGEIVGLVENSKKGDYVYTISENDKKIVLEMKDYTRPQSTPSLEKYLKGNFFVIF